MEIPGSIKEKVNAAINGDTMATGIVFEWFRPWLNVHALHLCGNTADAQDVVQDTFIAALTHLETLRDASSFYPWLKRILVNNCYQLLRRQKPNNFDEKLVRSNFTCQSVDHHFEKISGQQQLYNAMHYLSEELRACVMLRYFSGFNSYYEIAKLLSIPVGTVRSRLSAARQKLIQLYARFEDVGERLFNQSKEWSGYYQLLWTKMYDDANIRNKLFEHLQPKLTIRFTSGKFGQGRKILEREINDDLYFGTRFNVQDINSCGNITIIEGFNSNTKDYPDRCPPSTVLVLLRQNSKIGAVHIFDSPRS